MLRILRLLDRARRQGRLTGAAGMTVVEVSIATALLLVIMAPALFFLASTQRNEINVENASNQQADARLALQSITRFLREAEYPAGTTFASTGSDMFAVTGTEDVAFFSELNAVTTGAANGTIYKIEYKVEGPNLNRYVTAPQLVNGTYQYGTPSVTPVITDVRNDSYTGCTNFNSTTTLFTYSKQDPSTGQLVTISNPTANQSQINYVTINLVTGAANNQSPGCNEVQTAVALRNWRP